jgi:flagellin
VINGISIGAIAQDASAVVQGRSAATAINAESTTTGVSAVADSTTGAITLTSSEGRDIAITSLPATAAGAQAIQNATGLDVSAAANASGFETETITVEATDPILADTFTAGGLTYEFVTTVGDATTGSNVGVELSATEATQATNIQTAVMAQHALGNTSMQAVAGATTVAFTSDLLGTATIAYSDSSTALTSAGAASGGTAAADGTGNTTRGSLTLSSAENFSLGGTDLALAGLATAAPALTKLSSVDISTVAGANSAIAVLDGALSQVSSQRSTLGALQNRFTLTVSNLANSAENLSAARSQIQDADFASETASLARNQILQQAGIAMLSQANSAPQNVLSLLQ